jgi:signal transduction histidine kinase
LNKISSIQLRESLGFRVLKTFIVIVVIVLSVYTFFSIFREYKEVKKNLRSEGEALANLLAHSSKLGVFSEKRELLENIANGISNHRYVKTVTIYKSDLKPLYTVNKNSYRKDLYQGEKALNKKVADKLTTSQSLEVTDKWNTVEFLKPVVIETFPKETLYFDNKGDIETENIIGYVSIVFDKDYFHKKILSILLSNALVALIFIFSSVIIIYLSIKKFTKPLEKLSEHVRKLGMGEHLEKLSIESKDEIGRLATTFNEMYENLKKREEEKELLEENLANAKKMEAIGTLARGIAHDFNNILATVRGSVHMLKKKLGDDDPLQKYTMQIYKSTKRAKDLVQMLLIFSRTQDSHFDLVDINNVIKEMHPMPIGENIIYNETLMGKPLRVMADRLKIEQVIMNIISNAQDAMPEGGHLFLKTDIEHIDAENTRKEPFKPHGKYALVSISDTGMGISKETKDRIFEPFFSTKKTGKGTGLGLSIVYGIIEEHKGYIDVETREEGGTTFKIYLPIAGDDSEATP